MKTYYEMTERMAELTDLLQDELSKNIFWARVQYDIRDDIDSLLQLASLNRKYIDRKEHEPWRDAFRRLHESGKKIILYGAGGCGIKYGSGIMQAGEDFYAFCDRDFERYAEGLLGKKVLSPDYLFQNIETSYVLISAVTPSDRIFKYLMDHGFPQDHVLPYFYVPGEPFGQTKEQYFEFPELYQKDTAFVDAGCYRGETSSVFAHWCGEGYSKIYAFEPDAHNFKYCEELAKNNNALRMELFLAGLGEKEGVVQFSSCGTADSFIVDDSAARMVATAKNSQEKIEEIAIVSIDDIVKEDTVGFIKMDIEGAEYDALKGAKNTIMRDKPLCAICVYHRRGDVLAIMDYLHELVPEYRFWLRHYSPTYCETVLYAAK